jgi:hypothetical protein
MWFDKNESVHEKIDKISTCLSTAKRKYCANKKGSVCSSTYKVPNFTCRYHQQQLDSRVRSNLLKIKEKNELKVDASLTDDAKNCEEIF